MFATTVLIALMGSTPDISIYDSKANSKKVWILVDDCPVEIDKKKIKDTNYVIRMINEVCHLNINTKSGV